MHPTSTSLGGQLGFAEAAGEEQPGSTFLILSTKSGGHSVSPESDSCSDQILTRSFLSRLDLVDIQDSHELHERLRRYAGRLDRSLTVAKWILAQPEWVRYHPIARKVENCGAFLLYRHYFTVGEWRLAGAVTCCWSLLCPFCASLRASKQVRKVVPKVMAVVKRDGVVPYLLTLTIRSEPSVPEMFKRLAGFWSRVVAARREALAGKRVGSVWCEFQGGVVSFETKRGSGSGLWHCHLHAVIVGRPGLKSGDVQDAWSAIVGYRAQADLRQLNAVDERGEVESAEALFGDLQEVFKYAVKCGEMAPADTFEAFRGLRSKRLIRAFGSLFGVDLDPDLVDDVASLGNLPYRLLGYRLHRAADGRGRYLEHVVSASDVFRGRSTIPDSCPSTPVLESGQCL